MEVKSSILPTDKTSTKSHKSGILKNMLEFIEQFASDDPRFEFSRIRDNLETVFSPVERIVIHNDLIPPGPKLNLLGVTVTNSVTMNHEDDDFILTSPCSTPFDYYALVVSDLKSLAEEAYGCWLKIKEAGD